MQNSFVAHITLFHLAIDYVSEFENVDQCVSKGWWYIMTYRSNTKGKTRGSCKHLRHILCEYATPVLLPKSTKEIVANIFILW